MKLLIITQYFWPENFRINDLVEGLKARGHDITVLTGQPNYPEGTFFQGYGLSGPWEDSFNGVRVLRMPLLPRGKGKGLALVLNYFSFALSGSLGVLLRLRKKDGFEAIFVFEPSPITVGIPAALARMRFRIPMLFWVLDLWPESLSDVNAVRSKNILSMVERMVRWIYSQCDKILVPSRAFIPQIIRHGVPNHKIEFFPNWGEQVFDDNAREGRAINKWPAGFCVLYAGNIGAAQDIASVIEAAFKLKSRRDIHWMIAGEGRMGDWAKSEVTSLGLEFTVHFLGQRPLAEMSGLFATSDALLITLKAGAAFSLTIPGKLQSYLASGKPILAMLDGEGARIVGESGAGLTCSAGNSSELAANVLQMAQMPQADRARMGDCGRNYYQRHFSRDIVFDSLDALLLDAKVNKSRKI